MIDKPEGYSDTEDMMYALQSAGITERAETAAREGESFTAGDKVTGVTDTANILLENTSTDQYIVLHNSYIAFDKTTTVTMYKNVTVDAAGTELSPMNDRTDEPNSTFTTAQLDATVSGGESWPPVFSPGTLKSSPSFVKSSTVIVAPGDNILLEVVNNDDKDAIGSLSVEWFETTEEALTHK